MSKGARSGYQSDDLVEFENLHQELIVEGSRESSPISSVYNSPMSSSSMSVKDLRKSIENLLNLEESAKMGVPVEILLRLSR